MDFKTIIIISVLSFILLILLLWYVRTLLALKKEERINKFALSINGDGEETFVVQITNSFYNLVFKVGKLLKKSVVLSNYAKSYEKHIRYDERNKKDCIDFVAIKFIVGFTLCFLDLITMMLQLAKFNVMSLLIAFLIGFFIYDIILKIRFNRNQKRIEDDLLEAIIIMNNAFKAGRNIMQAVDIVKTELDGPISDEFKKIYMDMTYGLSLDVVFDRFYDRVKLSDAKYIASSLTLLNKTGGNIVNVFSSIEKSFYSKKKLKQELKSLTASSTFVFRILLFLPFIFGLVIFILNPSFFKPLFTTMLGLIILLLIIGIYSLYIVVVKKVLKVDI